jgi:uncharacterized protein YqeY
MKINELIKAANANYMPLKKEEFKAKKEGRELTQEQKDELFKYETTLSFYKIIKGIFVEQFTKNEGLVGYLVGEKMLTLRQEKAIDPNGKEVTVSIVNEPMDVRVDMMPEKFYQPLFEEMVKGHKKNIEAFIQRNDQISLAKEKIELDILESFLPKEATKEDVEAWLNENYPNGIDMKQMGPTIGKVKAAFGRADGRMISEVVKQFANK